MLKRVTALCLVFAMLLALVSCGVKSEGGDGSSSVQGVDKTYASDSAMDVFDAIQAVKNTKDCTFHLQMNTLDAESGEVSKTKYDLTGAWYTSTKQAYMEVSMEGEPFTTIVIDGNMLYVDAASAANALADRFAALDTEDSADYVEDLQASAQAFETDYLSFTLTEDPWTTLDGDSFSSMKQEMQTVYEAIQKSTQDQVKQEDSTCSITLGLGDLQDVFLTVTGSLTENKSAYQDFLTTYLEQNFDSFLTAAGGTPADYLDTRWAEYEELNSSLSSLAADGSWNDWTMKLITCGDESSGYTLDFYDYNYKSMNYCLTVVPAEAADVQVPEKSSDHGNFDEQLATVYNNLNIYNNLAYGGVEDDYSDTYSDDEDADGSAAYNWDDLEDTEVVEEIETSAISDYQNIVSTDMVTDDGIAITVPVFAKYDYAEAGKTSQGVNDVFVNTDGYVMQYVSIDNQDSKTFVQENVDTYVSTFQEDWGYEITQQASDLVQSADGKVTAAGMGYYDTDEGQEVTVITGCIQVDGSSYLMGFDLFLYSKSVTDNEIKSVQELFNYWGADVPVNLVKS